MVTASFCLNMAVQAQSVSLKMKNISVKEAIEQLKNKSGYSFVYKVGELDTKRLVTVEATRLSDAVEQILKGQGFTYEIKGKSIILRKTGTTSDRSKQSPTGKKQKVTGVVKDSNGDPVIGASVKEKGTTNGIITDLDGNFSLEVPEGSILEISFIGYTTQELHPEGGKMLDVTLKADAEQLDEVVVVGYGVQKRASITGSVASIQSKDITSVKTPNVSNALAGKLPGLRAVQRSGAPGDDDASIDIRGYGNALVIVDGVERDFKQIDANDIESISILKDASAAVYGFKGANGVILVTTKKGEQGKPKISYNGYVGIQNITRYPEYYNGYEYATLYNEAQQNIGVAAPYSAEDLELFRQGIGTTDWYNEVIRKTAPSTYHNLSVSGGAEKVKYFFSLGFTNQEGIYRSKAFDFKKYNVRANISAEIVKGFSVDLLLSGRLDTRMKPYEDEPLSRSIQMAKPIFPVYANNNPEYWQNPGDKGNPVHLSEIENVGYDRRDRRVFNGAITLNWNIPWLDGLAAKALFSYDYDNKYSRRWYKEYYEYSYDSVKDVYNVSGKHTISELTTRTDNYFKPNGQLSLN